MPCVSKKTSENYNSVGYEYRIGKYEVTNAQYAEFVNTVDAFGENPNNLYNTDMGSNVRGRWSYPGPSKPRVGHVSDSRSCSTCTWTSSRSMSLCTLVTCHGRSTPRICASS